MFSHVMVGCSDLDRSRRFYDAVFGTLGVGPGHLDRHRIFWRSKTGVFAATLPINGEPQTVGNGGTIGFACDTPEKVDAWHAARIPRASGRAPPASCTWPTCVIRTATSCARRTASRSRLPPELANPPGLRIEDDQAHFTGGGEHLDAPDHAVVHVQATLHLQHAAGSLALRQFSRLLAADRGRGSWQQDGEAEDEGGGGEGEAQHWSPFSEALESG